MHLLNRLAYGPSPADLRAIEQLGVANWMERQLRPDWIPDEAVSAKLHAFPTLVQSTDELHARFLPLKVRAEMAGIDTASPDAREAVLRSIPREDLPQGIVVELVGAKLVRAVESKRQLQEVLVDFWFNHFNVSVEKGEVKWMLSTRASLHQTLFELAGKATASAGRAASSQQIAGLLLASPQFQKQ